MKLPRRSILIPVVLLLYLGVMSYIGYPQLRTEGPLYYFGIIAVTLVCIILLYLHLRRRERRVREKGGRSGRR